MRMNAKSVEEREQFMLEIFQKNPDLSVAKANDLLNAKFKSKMRASRAYELRTVARKTTGKAGHVAVAARVSKIVGEGGKRLVIIEGSPDQMEFLKSAFSTMSAAGFPIPTIDHTTNNYAVVRA